MKIKRIVLTGPPSSGKTTVVEKLNAMGYAVMEEYSRQLIEVSLRDGTGITPWDKLEEFSKQVYQKRIEQFEKADKEIVFYDRGIIDTIAYLIYDNLSIADYHPKAQELKYERKVLFMPFWEDIFTVDASRLEDMKRANDIEGILRETYLKYGYEIIEVPKDTIDNRLKFIINFMDNLK